MRKIFVVGSSVGYANWMKGELVEDMKDADLVVFTGGEDVHPSFYWDVIGKYTYCNLKRDIIELEHWNKAVELNKRIIGICRGAQFACALSGGVLIQHQNNHKAVHPIKTFDGKIIDVTSDHHQAQFPYLMDEDQYKLLAFTEGMSSIHWNGKNEEISNGRFLEAEIVYYPKTKALGIQGHPEWMYGQKSFDLSFVWLNEILDRHLHDQL